MRFSRRKEDISNLEDDLWDRVGGHFARLSSRIFAVQPWADNVVARHELESAIRELYAILDPLVRFHLGYFDARNSSDSFSRARFSVEPSSATVEVSQDIWANDMGRVILHRMIFTLPVMANLRRLLGKNTSATFTIGLGDSADHEDVGFCSRNANCLLIPDSEFLGTGGYLLFRQYIANLWIDWEKRKSTVFWRGSATGIPRSPGTFDVRSEPSKFLPRLELCARLQRLADCDVGITAPELILDGEVKRFVTEQLTRARVERTDQIRFRYLVEIDGISNAWSAAFTAMIMGSCILKVASPMQFRQWYYAKRLAWKHYIPIASDLSDLEEKIGWALRHPRQAKRIAANGRKLASELRYAREVELAAQKIAARFAD
jgi:Glycosyl transferase family 90